MQPQTGDLHSPGKQSERAPKDRKGKTEKGTEKEKSENEGGSPDPTLS